MQCQAVTEFFSSGLWHRRTQEQKSRQHSGEPHHRPDKKNNLPPPWTMFHPVSLMRISRIDQRFCFFCLQFRTYFLVIRHALRGPKVYRRVKTLRMEGQQNGTSRTLEKARLTIIAFPLQCTLELFLKIYCDSLMSKCQARSRVFRALLFKRADGVITHIVA